jgi:hypothetical protein
MHTSVIENTSATSATLVDPKSMVLAVDATVTIGTSSDGTVLATATGGISPSDPFGGAATGKWMTPTDEYPLRFKTSRHAPGIIVDLAPTKLDSRKYRVELRWGSAIGVRPVDGVRSAAVFPLEAVRAVEVTR